jgi:hypothetical protein
MSRFNFTASAMLFVGIALVIGFSGCSESSTPAPNETAVASAPAASPPMKRPAPPPPPPSSAFDSSPVKTTDAGQSSAATAAQPQPDSKPAANRTYPPQMLPDATTDIPAWVGKDKDEPFDVKKFLESRAAPADNAAPLYFEAMAEISPKVDFVYPPDQWEERFPKVKALAEDKSRLFVKLKDGPVDLSELESILKRAEVVQEKIDKAQKLNKCVFITGMRIDSKLLHLNSAGQICDLEILQIYHASKNDNFPESEQAIKRTFRLAHDICPRGCLNSLWVAIDLESCILGAIKDFTFTQKLTANDYDRLIDMLIEQQQGSIPALKEALRMNYIMGRNTIEDIRERRLTLDDLRKIFTNNPDEFFVTLGNYLQHVDWSSEITTYNQVYSSLLGMADQPYYEIMPDRYETEVVSKLRNKNSLLINWLISNFPKTLDARVTEQANLCSTLCIVTVRKYSLPHGKPPPYLSTAIAGTALKEIPVDPFTGKSMRYESDGKGFKILYGSEPKNPYESGN